MQGIDMIILSLRQHFPARFQEWLVAGMLLSWGSYVVIHPELFAQAPDRQVFVAMADMVAFTDAPAFSVWGLAALLTGFLRVGALFVNGAYTRTPMIRLAMSFASAFIWTQVTVGLINSGVPNTGLMIYPWLIVADLVSAYRASKDVVFAERVRQDSLRKIGLPSRDNASSRLA